jgi:hypothetical protein
VSDYLPHPEPPPEEDDVTYVVSELPRDHSVRLTKDFGATRNVLALVIAVSYALCAILVVIGGLEGKFGPEVVGPIVGALATSATAVAYFFFHRYQSKGE